MADSREIKLHFGGDWSRKREGRLTICDYKGGEIIKYNKYGKNQWKDLYNWVKTCVWWFRLGRIDACWTNLENERMGLIDDCTCSYFWDKYNLGEEGYHHIYVDIVNPLTKELIKEPQELDEQFQESDEASERDNEESHGDRYQDSEKEYLEALEKQERPKNLPVSRRVHDVCLS